MQIRVRNPQTGEVRTVELPIPKFTTGQLSEPVELGDVIDHLEYMESLMETTLLMFERLRVQYNGDTWVSNEVWAVFAKTVEAWEQLRALKNAGGFPE